MIKLIGIKVKDKGVYITDNINNDTYSSTKVQSYVINGEKPQPSFQKSWYLVSEEPKTVQQLVNQPNINRRYELIDKSLSDKFKDTYKEEDVFRGYNDDDEKVFVEGFIPALYQFNWDTQEPVLQDVEFEYETIAEIDNLDEPNTWSYPTYGQYGKVVSPITNNNVKRNMIDEIVTPKILIHKKPCKLTKLESFQIVRAFIKDNIDPKVAQITSDYDFCFAVEKRVPLHKPVEYTVDVNNNIFGGRKKKPKYENRVQKSKNYDVFKIAPAPYQSYNVIEEFEGDSEDNLQENIQAYLDHIIAVINEPLIECSCCGGTGHVILNKENNGK